MRLVGVEGYSDRSNLLVAELIEQRFHLRDILPTVGTPRSPEVEYHIRASEIRQTDFLLVGSKQLKVGATLPAFNKFFPYFASSESLCALTVIDISTSDKSNIIFFMPVVLSISYGHISPLQSQLVTHVAKLVHFILKRKFCEKKNQSFSIFNVWSQKSTTARR